MIISRLNLFVLSFTFLLALDAQVQPEVEKKHFVSPNGKLYWQGDLPIYFFISTKPNGEGKTRLESEATKEYTNPMYLDTEGANYIRSKWAYADGKYAVPKQEVVFEIFKDTRPTLTKLKYEGAPSYSKDNIRYFGKSLFISLSSSDALSGVESIYRSVDGASYTVYDSAIRLTADKAYKVTYYGVDNVGNVESPQSHSFIVDVTSPVTNHVVEGDQFNNVISERTLLKLSASDNSSGVKSSSYTLDDGSYSKFYRTISTIGIAEGDHNLS